jgi:hypothetical protein
MNAGRNVGGELGKWNAGLRFRIVGRFSGDSHAECADLRRQVSDTAESVHQQSPVESLVWASPNNVGKRLR